MEPSKHRVGAISRGSALNKGDQPWCKFIGGRVKKGSSKESACACIDRARLDQRRVRLDIPEGARQGAGR